MTSDDPAPTPSSSLERLATKPFVGRTALLGAARIAIDGARLGRGQCLLFSGEPGIGKTRLADEVLGLARHRGLGTIAARCHEIEGAPALWPWLQVVRGVLARLPDSEREARLAADGAILTRLIDRQAAGPSVETSSPDRFAVFDAVTRLLDRASSLEPLAILIDDLHWSDPASAMLLHYAVRELRHAPVLFVALFRHTGLSERTSLAHVLEGLASDAESFVLEGLEEEEIRDLVREVMGYEMADVFHAALRAHTGGNPLFMVEVIRTLVSEGRMGSPEEAVPDAIPLPGSIRTVIERRVDAVGELAARVLRQASLLGRELDVDLLEATGLSPDETRSGLDAGLDAGLLEQVDGSARRVRFTHDVVREVLERTLSEADRLHFHRRAADALLAARSLRLHECYAQLAAHLLVSAQAAGEGDGAPRAEADARAAFDYAMLAARQAYSNYSFEVACELLETALRALDAGGSGLPSAAEQERLALRGKALVLLADARWQSGLAVEAAEADREVEQIARRLGDPALRAQSVLGLAGRNDLPLDPPPEHARWLAEAYDALPEDETVLRLRLLAQRVRSSSFGDLGEELIRWAEECQRLAEELDDPWARFIARDAMHYALLPAEHLEARLEVGSSLPDLARHLGSSRLEALALLWRIFDRLQLPDRAGADRDAGRLRESAERMRRPFWRWLSLGVDACLALLDGDLPRTERLVFEALEVGQQAQTPNALIFFGTQLFHLREAQGRSDELLPLMEQIERERPGLPVFRIGIPLIHALAGRREEAQRTFDSVAAADFEDVPDDFHRLPMLTSCARVAAYLGDLPRAKRLRALLSPYEGRVVMAGVVTFWGGSVDRFLGALEEALGDLEAAARRYERSLHIAERAGARLAAAASRLDRARVLRAIGGEAPLTEAADLERTAITSLQALGVEPSDRAVPLAGRAMPGRTTPAASASIARFARGAYSWQLSFAGDDFELPDTKGLAYLHQLLATPDREIHVLDLVAAEEGAAPAARFEGSGEADAGSVLVETEWESVDDQALAAYRDRLRRLAEDRAAAESARDLGRLEAIDEEAVRIEDELRRVTGLGGRARPAGSSVEKARKSVYNRIRAAISRIEVHSPALARHLERSVTTGRSCVYRPEQAIEWTLEPD
ncbi:MAG: AAA family ATPase [bacterium]|nr:AAA family ATPase [bacterium]